MDTLNPGHLAGGRDRKDPVAALTKSYAPPRRRVLTLMAAALPLALSACAPANDSLAAQAKAGDSKNYVAGDGSVTEYAQDSRKPAVTFTGTLYNGATVASASFNGSVTILNFWYAACAPCRVEAPRLKALNDQFKPQGVVFYGVNLRDEKATAEAFEHNFGITYPSFDDKDGAVLLALSGMVPPGAVPTTLVLDRQGRVASRILGELQEGTLRALIDSTVAEPA